MGGLGGASSPHEFKRLVKRTFDSHCILSAWFQGLSWGVSEGGGGRGYIATIADPPRHF